MCRGISEKPECNVVMIKDDINDEEGKKFWRARDKQTLIEGINFMLTYGS